MIITSLQQAEAAGQVHRDAGVSRYPLVGPVTVGGATGDVSLLVLPPGTTHTLRPVRASRFRSSCAAPRSCPVCRLR